MGKPPGIMPVIIFLDNGTRTEENTEHLPTYSLWCAYTGRKPVSKVMLLLNASNPCFTMTTFLVAMTQSFFEVLASTTARTA